MYAFAWGSGAGELTEDGCAVEVYRRLPPGSEPEVIHAAVPPGARILELGAGAGRVTHPLLRLGHPVVAVDSSPAMLAHIRGAHTVAERIETLDLGEEFDAVVLGSHLVNVPDAELRAGFLRCCRRHLHPQGCVLIERHAPAWFDTAADAEHAGAEFTVRLSGVRRPAPGLVEATVRYATPNQAWTHAFRAQRLDDTELARVLRRAGLSPQRTLTDDDTWVRAVPAGDAPAPGEG